MSLTKYTIIGELDFGDGFFARFIDWSEGADPDDACAKLEPVLYKYNEGLQDWEMHFIIEGHHKDCYPIEGEDD